MSAASADGDNVAFLLSQLGHRSASVFADLIASIDLTPPHAGILRVIAAEPGRSQQALSGQLGLLPSRVVAYVDELEDLGYVERRRNPDDRRLHALYLTPSGKKALSKIGELGRQHERLMTAGLDTRTARHLAPAAGCHRRTTGPDAARAPGLSHPGPREAVTGAPNVPYRSTFRQKLER